MGYRDSQRRWGGRREKNKCKKLNELDVAQKNESEEVWTTASSGKLL